MPNFIYVQPEEGELKITMYTNDEPQTWIMFNEDQTENLIKVLKRELKALKKDKAKDDKSCKSQDPDAMCSFCNCWKITRAYCS
jgi:hypothetical protein